MDPEAELGAKCGSCAAVERRHGFRNTGVGNIGIFEVVFIVFQEVDIMDIGVLVMQWYYEYPKAV